MCALVDVTEATKKTCSILGFTTAQHVEALSKERPLTDEQKNLINNSFKPIYKEQMIVWALAAKNSRRRKLFDLLSLASATGNFSPRNEKKTHELIRQKDFVLHSGVYTIDLNRSFNLGSSRRRDPRHYRSAIKEQGVFGFPEEIAPKAKPQQQKSTSLGESFAREIFKEPFLSKFIPYAHSNVAFLKIIVSYLEMPSNSYPINPLKNTPLDPYNEMKIVRGTIKEDHVNAARYKVKSILPPPIKTRNRDGTTAFNTTRSNYSENFTDDPFKTIRPTRAVEPLRNMAPFSKFPTAYAEGLQLTREKYLEQARMNKEMGRKNRDIYVSKTCL